MSTNLKQVTSEIVPECNLKQTCKDAIGMRVERRRKKNETK
jgi:hypothetical protein